MNEEHDTDWPAALRIDCPLCGAPAMVPCSVGGRDGAHLARVLAAVPS